jgi:FixJ family two-component response regulator
VVFIADDSAVARLAIARRLRAEGFEVIEQATAAPPEAGALDRVACALLDLDLGESDGSNLGRALLAQRSELPIAFFSGSASPELLARARALGPVFSKPSQLEAAVAWIHANARTG